MAGFSIQYYTCLFLVGCLCFGTYDVNCRDDYDDYMDLLSKVTGLITDEALASKYAADMVHPLSVIDYAGASADWDLRTNMTDYNQERSSQVHTEAIHRSSMIANTSMRFDWMHFKNDTLKRLFEYMSNLAPVHVSKDDIHESSTIATNMQRIYVTARVSVGDRTNLGEPELADIMSRYGDYDELKEAWHVWHDTVGIPERKPFIEYIKLANESAVAKGYANLKESWVSDYNMTNFSDVIDGLWEDLSPLYKKLHAYVRMRLRITYPNILPEDGTIPAHLLGDMWAQQWGPLYPHLRKGHGLGISKALHDQGWTPEKMVRTAEDFFISLGLEPMPPTFWKKSIFSQPKDRIISCHPSSLDLGGLDFRISVCPANTTLDFLVVHHEMGHMANFMLHRHQHPMFRRAAVGGFGEAIGDLISLSVSTPSHYRRLGLLGDHPIDPADLLLLNALNQIAFLPYGYLLDKWRWSVMTGETPFESMNAKFWEYRIKFQGVSPPVLRTERHFDPGAKFHVAFNIPYVEYFVAFILQYQFHAYLCNQVGETGPHKPLHECDLYGQKAAGDILRRGLSYGQSKPWQDILEILSGTREISASSIKKYFLPIERWLDEQIKGETVGWGEAKASDYLTSAPSINQISAFTGVIVIVGMVLTWKNLFF